MNIFIGRKRNSVFWGNTDNIPSKVKPEMMVESLLTLKEIYKNCKFLFEGYEITVKRRK